MRSAIVQQKGQETEMFLYRKLLLLLLGLVHNTDV